MEQTRHFKLEVFVNASSETSGMNCALGVGFAFYFLLVVSLIQNIAFNLRCQNINHSLCKLWSLATEKPQISCLPACPVCCVLCCMTLINHLVSVHSACRDVALKAEFLVFWVIAWILSNWITHRYIGTISPQPVILLSFLLISLSPT